MLVLEARSVKFGGSLARNVRFGSLFLEKHEMLVLEAFVILAQYGVVLEGRRSDVVSEVGVVLCTTE